MLWNSPLVDAVAVVIVVVVIVVVFRVDGCVSFVRLPINVIRPLDELVGTRFLDRIIFAIYASLPNRIAIELKRVQLKKRKNEEHIDFLARIKIALKYRWQRYIYIYRIHSSLTLRIPPKICPNSVQVYQSTQSNTVESSKELSRFETKRKTERSEEKREYEEKGQEERVVLARINCGEREMA